MYGNIKSPVMLGPPSQDQTQVHELHPPFTQGHEEHKSAAVMRAGYCMATFVFSVFGSGEGLCKFPCLIRIYEFLDGPHSPHISLPSYLAICTVF
jgi:hypothetical protein